MTEITVQNGKFWLLEVKEEKKNTQIIFDNEKAAIIKVKESLKTVAADKLTLLTVDVAVKDWKINQVSWQTIVTAMVNV